MPDIVLLANMALSHCGTRSKINAIGEGSPEANACLTHLDMVRQASLRLFDWNFARKTATLANISLPIPAGQTVAPTSSVARWGYEYALPTDCVRMRRLNDAPMLLVPVDWYELAADRDANGNPINVIFTNDATATLIYTMDVTDPNRWDVGFADAYAWGLAHKICYELTGKSDRTRELAQEWQATLWQAAAGAANESPTVQPTWMPEGLAVRGYDDGLAEVGQAWPRSYG